MADRNPVKILIIDNDPEFRKKIVLSVQFMGYDALDCSRKEDCIDMLTTIDDVSVVLLYTEAPDDLDFQIMKYVYDNLPHVLVVILTPQRNIETSIKVVKLGASYYLTKSKDIEHVKGVLKNALPVYNLRSEIGNLKGKLRRNEIFGSIIGEGKEIQKVFQIVEKVMDKDVNILITGESGTGKELLARSIHEGSKRKSGPFVAVNCASITPELADSLLFGHKKGSFTGSIGDHDGYFEQAGGGTIFLDEIGDMHIEIQAKVLRTIEEKKIRKVGGAREKTSDFRIISATNRDLSSAVSNKEFRSDLYFRLEQYPIYMPALQERKTDILVLARHFLNEFCEFYEIEQMNLSKDVERMLQNHSWPGNIRELKNVIRRAAIQSVDSVISEILISDFNESASDVNVKVIRNLETTAGSSPDDFNTGEEIIPLAELEKNAIEKAYQITNRNADTAAKLLGISRATFYRKLKQYSD